MKKLTHTDSGGKAVMVDVGNKAIQFRMAKAKGYISMTDETLKLIGENKMKKGDVLTVAQIAGINAAKQTGYLIPLCHNIILENVKVEFIISNDRIIAESEVSCEGRTGVEMEALTSVSVALLTIYDMCKAVDKKMVIGGIQLTEKIKK